jgi:UPF0755 protein
MEKVKNLIKKIKKNKYFKTVLLSKKQRIIILKIGLPLVAFLSILLGLFIFFYSSSPGDGSKQVDFVIESGAGSIIVTNKLYEEKLIKSRTYFKFMLRLTGNDGKIKRGIYVLNDGMSPGQIIDIITSGRTKTIKVVIPEGYNNRQIGSLLAEKKLFKSKDEFLDYTSDHKLLKKYHIPAKTVEGYLFPETYNFPVGFNKKKIVKLMVEQFIKKVEKINNFPKNPKKIHKIIILASIVEREAKIKSELPKIAGVFTNRLKENYPLESCATIQYLFDKPKKKLFYHDLERKSPYNTYINKGLPPGPISNPGFNAIEATVHPMETKYKYFVVKGDGSHHFSTTFAEHNKAKKKYLYK